MNADADVRSTATSTFTFEKVVVTTDRSTAREDMLDEYFVVATLLISLKYGDHANHPARPAASSFSRWAGTLPGSRSCLIVCACFAGVVLDNMKQNTTAEPTAAGEAKVWEAFRAFGAKSFAPHR